jgi:hypothetical protein
LKAVLVSIALLAAGCAPDAYTAPEAGPGVVIWVMLPAEQVPRACGHPEEPLVVGCAHGVEIITRPPEPGDYALVETLNHEVDHTQGWRHPAWPGGIK